jgi:hypothetical protein
MKFFLAILVVALVVWLLPAWVFAVLAIIAGAFLIPHGPEMVVPYFILALFGVACLFAGYVILLHYRSRLKWCRPLLFCGVLLLLPTVAQHFPEYCGNWFSASAKVPQSLTLTLPADTPPEAVELIKSVAPALEKQLPGLVKYQDSMTFAGVNAHGLYFPAPSSGLPHEVTVSWLEFVVADNGGDIPGAYRAWGHHLWVGIVDTGEALILKKTQTKSVFLDRLFSYTGEDLVIKI